MLIDRRLGELDLDLIRIGLDDEEDLPLLDIGAVDELHLAQEAGHPCDEIDGQERLGLAGEDDVLLHRLDDRRGDGHFRRRRGLKGRLLIAGRKGGAESGRSQERRRDALRGH